MPNRHTVSGEEPEKVLETDSGDGGTPRQMCSTPLNYILTVVKVENFMLHTLFHSEEMKRPVPGLRAEGPGEPLARELGWDLVVSTWRRLQASPPTPSTPATFEPWWVLGPGLGRNVLADGVQEVSQQLLPQWGPLV